jgi:hypothetical protein
VKQSLTRYRKVAACAEYPTPTRRLIAAVTAGAAAILLTQLTLGIGLGVGSTGLFFSSIALVAAAAVAAVTTKRGMAVAFGVLAAFWLLFEMVAALLGTLVVLVS